MVATPLLAGDWLTLTWCARSRPSTAGYPLWFRAGLAFNQCHRRQYRQVSAVYGAGYAVLPGHIQHQRDNSVSTDQGGHCLQAVSAFHLGTK
jgi:hypothetical protein